jgi:hypothetical protein
MRKQFVVIRLNYTLPYVDLLSAGMIIGVVILSTDELPSRKLNIIAQSSETVNDVILIDR